MSIYTIYDQTTGKVAESAAIKNPIIVELNIEQKQIKNIIKTGDDLIVSLESSEQITIKDYYANTNNEIVIKNTQGQYFELKLGELSADGIYTEVDYLPIENFTDYLYKDVPVFSNMAVVGAGVAAGVAGIAVAVAENSSSSDTEKAQDAKSDEREALEQALEDSIEKAKEVATELLGASKQELEAEIIMAKNTLINSNSSNSDLQNAKVRLDAAVAKHDVTYDDLDQAQQLLNLAISNAELALNSISPKLDGAEETAVYKALLEASKVSSKISEDLIDAANKLNSVVRTAVSDELEEVIAKKNLDDAISAIESKIAPQFYQADIQAQLQNSINSLKLISDRETSTKAELEKALLDLNDSIKKADQAQLKYDNQDLENAKTVIIDAITKAESALKADANPVLDGIEREKVLEALVEAVKSKDSINIQVLEQAAADLNKVVADAITAEKAETEAEAEANKDLIAAQQALEAANKNAEAALKPDANPTLKGGSEIKFQMN